MNSYEETSYNIIYPTLSKERQSMLNKVRVEIKLEIESGAKYIIFAVLESYFPGSPFKLFNANKRKNEFDINTPYISEPMVWALILKFGLNSYVRKVNGFYLYEMVDYIKENNLKDL